MEAQPGGGTVIRLVAEGLDPISLPNLEFDGPDQLLGAVSRSIGLSNAQLALATRPSQQRDSSAIDQRTRALLIKHTPVSY